MFTVSPHYLNLQKGKKAFRDRVDNMTAAAPTPLSICPFLPCPVVSAPGTEFWPCIAGAHCHPHFWCTLAVSTGIVNDRVAMMDTHCSPRVFFAMSCCFTLLSDIHCCSAIWYYTIKRMQQRHAFTMVWHHGVQHIVSCVHSVL